MLWHPYKETARFFVFLKVSANLGFKFGKMSIEFYLSVLGVFKPLIVFQFFFLRALNLDFLKISFLEKPPGTIKLAFQDFETGM